MNLIVIPVITGISSTSLILINLIIANLPFFCSIFTIIIYNDFQILIFMNIENDIYKGLYIPLLTLTIANDQSPLTYVYPKCVPSVLPLSHKSFFKNVRVMISSGVQDACSIPSRDNRLVVL